LLALLLLLLERGLLLPLGPLLPELPLLRLGLLPWVQLLRLEQPQSEPSVLLVLLLSELPPPLALLLSKTLQLPP
jgi:hypothetical protein